MAIHSQQNKEALPLDGVVMSEQDFERLTSGETAYHYEWIAGKVYNMSGSTPEHADLAYNVAELFKTQLGKQGPCRVYLEQYVAIPDRPAVIPDVVITCNVDDRDKKTRPRPFRISSPLIVVEILSPSTEAYDRTEKFARYMLCPSLEVYILVSQTEQRVEVYRRSTNWKPELFSAGKTIQLDQLDLELPIDVLYEGVFE